MRGHTSSRCDAVLCHLAALTPRRAGALCVAAVLVFTGKRDVHRQHYSAERMSLVVLGGQSLDELANTVQRLFSAVPSGRGPRPEFSSAGRPFKVRLQAAIERPVLFHHATCVTLFWQLVVMLCESVLLCDIVFVKLCAAVRDIAWV